METTKLPGGQSDGSKNTSQLSLMLENFQKITGSDISILLFMGFLFTVRFKYLVSNTEFGTQMK